MVIRLPRRARPARGPWGRVSSSVSCKLLGVREKEKANVWDGAARLPARNCHLNGKIRRKDGLPKGGVMRCDGKWVGFLPKNGKPAWGSQVACQPSGGSPSAEALDEGRWQSAMPKGMTRLMLMLELYRKPPFVLSSAHGRKSSRRVMNVRFQITSGQNRREFHPRRWYPISGVSRLAHVPPARPRRGQ